MVTSSVTMVTSSVTMTFLISLKAVNVKPELRAISLVSH